MLSRYLSDKKESREYRPCDCRSTTVFLLVILGCLCNPLTGQHPDSPESNLQEELFPYPAVEEARHVELGAGIAGAGIRDLATSPLFYRGPVIGGSLGFSRRNSVREFLFGLHSGAGILISSYNNTGSTSLYARTGVNLYWLKDINKWATGGFRFLFGPAGQFTNGIRVNSSLGNNSFALENQVNLSFSSKIIADISRKKAIKRPWLLGGLKKPAQRELSFQFNIGLLNANFRPGYSFSGLPALRGDEEDGPNLLFYDYKWRINGFRLFSQLNYTWYIPTGNAYRLTYMWDASNLPGRFEAMQIAVHTLQFAFIFKKM